MNAMASRFQPVIQTPFDVRVMNATSSLLLTAVLLAALAASLWWWLCNPVFSFQRIVVHGQTAHNDADSLRERVLPRLTGNFFTLDMAQAQAAFQSAPWVERAVVWRRWPGLLDVILQEHQPYARWGASGERMIDVNGQLFDAETPATISGGPDVAALPALTGPDGQSATVLAMYRALDPLVAPIDARMAALQLEDRGSWRARLTTTRGASPGGPSGDASGNAPDSTSGGAARKPAGRAFSAVIELGSGAPDELAARLQTFVATAPEVAARYQRGVADIETVDLRHPNGYALRLRGVGTTTDAAQHPTPATRVVARTVQPAPRGVSTAARR